MKRLGQAALFPLLYHLGRGRRDGGITILSYHSIDEHTTGISVALRRFADQMATLAAEQCPTFTMGQVAAHISDRRPFPPRAVAITFDDGFASVATLAKPILAHFSLTATVYVITGMIGRRTAWRTGGRPIPSLPLADWSAIRALSDGGFEIGAHTATHPFLTRCGPAQLTDELVESREVLTRALGMPVQAFAYPQGDYDDVVAKAVGDAGYTTAVTLDQGRALPTTDPLRIPRLHVGNNATPATIRAFTVPTIGPTYRLTNLLIRGMLRRRTWPRPDPASTQSSDWI